MFYNIFQCPFNRTKYVRIILRPNYLYDLILQLFYRVVFDFTKTLKNNSLKKNKEEYNPANVALKGVDFERIYRSYFPALCRYARGIVENVDDAKDIVSNFFLRLWENKEKIIINGAMSMYFYQSVRNCCLNHLKKEKERREYNINICTREDEHLFYPDDNNPLTILTTQELEREIEQAIETLPKQCREVFRLVNEEGLQYQEVAKKLGITIGSVGKQYDRAKTKLRNLLKVNEK